MTSLDVQGMWKRFGGVSAVEDVSLSAASGGITALIGPNGAGKTTLFNLISGFERADRGHVAVGGRVVRRPRPFEMCRRMGVIRTFQVTMGFPRLTVLENMMVAGADSSSQSLTGSLIGRRSRERQVKASEERASALLQEIGLWARRDVLTEDLAAGEIKLLEFARPLMMTPRVLMLDEPAAGVDPSHVWRISSAIRERKKKGLTVVVIDHNLEFILDIADFVYVLTAGKVLRGGAPDEIAADPAVIDVYIGG